MSTRLPRGVTQTATGWRISVRVTGRPRFTKRFKAHVPLETVQEQLANARQRLRAGRGSLSAGTLATDVTRYLRDHLAGAPAHDERQRHLELWITALGGATWRAAITRTDVTRILNDWRAAGLAADTCNKRRTALLALYHALDGKGGSNPVRDVPKFRAPDPLPRGIDYGLIEAALAELPVCKTQARLRVMAYTGIRAGQLMRIDPAVHWDTARQALTVPGTRKGRGTKPYTLPLSVPATQALKALDRLDAWGRFTWAPMARMWKAAATKAKLPEGTTPRDLRHSFGTAIYRATGDLKVTKELMGHAALRMTERYMLAAVPERAAGAMRAFERAVRTKAKGTRRGTKTRKRA